MHHDMNDSVIHRPAEYNALARLAAPCESAGTRRFSDLVDHVVTLAASGRSIRLFTAVSETGSGLHGAVLSDGAFLIDSLDDH